MIGYCGNCHQTSWQKNHPRWIYNFSLLIELSYSHKKL